MPDAKLLRSAMPIKLTRRADQDIVRMFLEGSKRFGISQAQNYRRGFERACAFIADNASSVRERTEYSPPVRIHRYRSHVIIFRIEDADIVVLRVRHGAEDWMTDPIGANDQQQKRPGSLRAVLFVLKASAYAALFALRLRSLGLR